MCTSGFPATVLPPPYIAPYISSDVVIFVAPIRRVILSSCVAFVMLLCVLIISPFSFCCLSPPLPRGFTFGLYVYIWAFRFSLCFAFSFIARRLVWPGVVYDIIGHLHGPHFPVLVLVLLIADGPKMEYFRCAGSHLGLLATLNGVSRVLEMRRATPVLLAMS